MKVFISQQYRGLTDEEVLAFRKEVIDAIRRFWNDAEIIDTYIREEAPKHLKDSRIWYLGKSIELMADADLFVDATPAGTTTQLPGCYSEWTVANLYGIPVWNYNRVEKRIMP